MSRPCDEQSVLTVGHGMIEDFKLVDAYAGTHFSAADQHEIVGGRRGQCNKKQQSWFHRRAAYQAIRMGRKRGTRRAY